MYVYVYTHTCIYNSHAWHNSRENKTTICEHIMYTLNKIMKISCNYTIVSPEIIFTSFYKDTCTCTKIYVHVYIYNSKFKITVV